ncbi:DBH-like monooxygenase protein 1 homolog [Corticium candelabrum]|uniref:DBH-like monooxygenase protein 1 homolog n=1 Tax=Corticium candelabrum TaxID=121492 RepID=UPI002E271587|nr:DBH-like monooxygenase protein 1 homolog [Corticium candelabrum]
MWRILLLFVLATSSVVQCDHHLCPSGYSRGQYLDASTQKYLLCWKVDWSDRSITFSAKVATTGWIGLGFSPTGFMPNSDVIIGWVKDSQGYLKDRFATARSQPQIDDIQNVRLLSFSEADGMTTLEFKRDLEACEPKDRSIEEGTTRVIFSYNHNDPTSETALDKHTFAQRISVNLLSGTGNVEPAPLEMDHETFDVLNHNVSVPAQLTTYWCTPYKLPRLQNEAHIIRFEPVVQANHEELVHHIIIYTCLDVVVPYLDMSWDCDNPPDSVPDSVQGCRDTSVIAGWAVGGSGITFPSQVGLPLSGQTGAQYVMMETHYNNEQRKKDYIDSSGMRLYYTPTKRRYDSSMLVFGHTVNSSLLLPPGKDEIITETVCPAACTQVGLPSTGVNVFGTILHSHTVGKGIWIEHSRGGVQLPNIDSNYNYDFNFQDFVLLRNEVKILPGDVVQVFCDYDTSARTQVTIGEEGTLDEMCLAFLLVYPRPQLFSCLSQIGVSVLRSYINQATLKGYYSDLVNNSAYEKTQRRQFEQSVRNMDWSNDDAYTLWEKEFWSSKKRDYFCNDQMRKNLLGAPEEVGNSTSLPEITQPLTDARTPKPCTTVTTESPTSSSLDLISNLFLVAVLPLMAKGIGN